MSKQSRTRLELIKVARQLFARDGVQGTTMNDVAVAAGRGRRTVYTYFKSKYEIVNAVIDYELNDLRRELEITQREYRDPETRLFRLIHVHLEVMKKIVLRNGNLEAQFFKDIWLVEKARILFDRFERQLIVQILNDGIEARVFSVPHVETMAYLLQTAIKSMEVPFISGHVSPTRKTSFELIQENLRYLLLQGIKVSKELEYIKE